MAQFTIGGDFAPQGIFGNVLRNCHLSQWGGAGGANGIQWIESMVLLSILQRTEPPSHVPAKHYSAPKCQ